MKRLLIRAGRLIYIFIFGLPTTVWLLLRDRHTVYYIPHIGLGDYCISLGYLESFKKKYNIEHVTVVVPSNRVEVVRYYLGWDSLLLVKRPLYIGVSCLGGVPFGRTIHRKTRRIRSVYPSIYLSRGLMYDNPSISMDGLIKLILKLPGSEERKAPEVPETNIDGIIEDFGLQKGTTVLLNPYTSNVGVAEINNDFYLKLTEKLKQNGFMVVTILGSENQKPLPGTRGVVTSLRDAWHLVRWCGWLIGTRSGFFDFIRFSGCNIIGIYEPTYKLREIYSLVMPNRDEHVREYIWEANREDEVIENILSVCLQWKEAVVER